MEECPCHHITLHSHLDKDSINCQRNIKEERLKVGHKKRNILITNIPRLGTSIASLLYDGEVGTTSAPPVVRVSEPDIHGGHTPLLGPTTVVRDSEQTKVTTKKGSRKDTCKVY